MSLPRRKGSGMSVRQMLPLSPSACSLDDARPLYFLPRDNLAEEVLIPGFNEASTAACMIGFFSSAALADLAPGLATFIQNTESCFRMIVSPFLTDNDQSAIEAGLKNPEELAADILETGFVSADDLQKHTLKCLSYLLSKGRIEIKIALMKNALFHPKVWLFETQAGRVAVHGSGNATRSGIRKNKEQITVSKSWVDPTQKYISDKFSDEFEMLWRNQDEDCLIVSLPEAIKQKLLRDYPADRRPTEDDFIKLYKRASKEASSEYGVGITPINSILLTALDAFPEREIVLVHAVLNEDVQAFRLSFDALAQKHKNLKVYYRYSDAPQTSAANASNGFVTAEYLESLLPGRDADYYFCGPQPFMVALYHGLIQWGIPASQVHFEFFGPRQELGKAA